MVLLLLASFLAIANPAPADTLSVGTFNIRYGAARDGDNRWELRKDLLLATARKMDNDVIGFQEVLDFQLDELKKAFPNYEFVGVGRNDGKSDGEFVPVAFKRDRFELLAHGHFWLSETPEKVGSIGWDARLPRISTWVRLKQRSGGQVIFFMNTHFDHMGKRARFESAKLLRSEIQKLRDGAPAILVGDFNARETDDTHTALAEEKPGALNFVDSFRSAHPQRGKEEGTFHEFTGSRTRDRIDWILHTSDFTTRSCEIIYDSDQGRYPSDHYPVSANLEISKTR